MKMDFGAAAGIPIPDFHLSALSLASPPLPLGDMNDLGGSVSHEPEASSYGSPNRMQVLANGDIIDCGRLPQTARNNLYKTELCKHFMDTGACRYGSKCQFAHGEHELRGVLRHPKYKTTRCKAFVSTGKCMYGNRCRFIHGDSPEDDLADSFSSTGSESDDQESPLKDLMVNPYVHGTESIDLLIPFGGLKQVTLTPLTSIGSSASSSSPASPPADIDAFLFRDPFASTTTSDLKLPSELSDVPSSSSITDALSPSAESAAAKFSRLSIFQRICREDA
ncbi:Zinc finger domain containing protein [Globisporangium polare]